MNEFDLRSFLYNNPLLESEAKLKAAKEKLEKQEAKLDKVDMKDEDAKEKAKHHKKSIKNVKKEIKDLEKDLKFDEKAAKKEEKEAKAEAKAKKKKKAVKEGLIKEDMNELVNENTLSDLEKKYGKDLINFVIGIDELTPEEIKDTEYLDDRIQTHLEEPEIRQKYLPEGKLNKVKGEKMTKEGLKEMIRERITSILNEDAELYEAEEEEDNVDIDVEKDVNIDVKDEVDVDDESVESDVEIKTSIPGADKDTDEVLGLLTKASEKADVFSDDPELKTQIGNVITYFTRKHIAKV